MRQISASDEKTLDVAIAMANELAARSMNNVDGIVSSAKPDSPDTPVSPNKRKFSFRFPTPNIPSRPEGKTFSDEAASIPDIQVFVYVPLFYGTGHKSFIKCASSFTFEISKTIFVDIIDYVKIVRSM